MTKLTDDCGVPLPLVVPCKANAKSDEHRIYLNHAGIKVLQGLLEQLLNGARDPAGIVWQNGEEVRLRLHTSVQEDFDSGGPPILSLRESIHGIGTFRKIMPPRVITDDVELAVPTDKPVKVLDPPTIPVNQLVLDDVQHVPADQMPTIKEQLPINAFMPQTLKEAHAEILTLRQHVRNITVPAPHGQCDACGTPFPAANEPCPRCHPGE